MEEKELEEGYDFIAEKFLESRTSDAEITGWENREIEQPTMYELVPHDLNGKKLLDIGCGPGIHLKKYIERGAEGFGIDLSTNMIKLAKEHCPKGTFKMGNIYALEFEDDSNYF